jgi:hypothetical protein
MDEQLICFCGTETIKKSKNIFECDFCNETFITDQETGQVTAINKKDINNWKTR